MRATSCRMQNAAAAGRPAQAQALRRRSTEGPAQEVVDLPVSPTVRPRHAAKLSPQRLKPRSHSHGCPLSGPVLEVCRHRIRARRQADRRDRQLSSGPEESRTSVPWRSPGTIAENAIHERPTARGFGNRTAGSRALQQTDDRTALCRSRSVTSRSERPAVWLRPQA